MAAWSAERAAAQLCRPPMAGIRCNLVNMEVIKVARPCLSVSYYWGSINAFPLCTYGGQRLGLQTSNGRLAC